MSNIILVIAPTKEKNKFMLQKSSGKIRMPIPNFSLETTRLGIRRASKTNSRSPTWKVRVG
jgi:hypothetical protein